MADWSLSGILSVLHEDIQQRLQNVRKTLGHPVTKGDASERVWLELLKKYLPHRYQAETAHIVDSKGNFSEQIDVVVFDRQYTPFIFHYEGKMVIPAEGVYAVFESKQSINAEQIKYAQSKVASVRQLHRTSLPIPHAGGTYPPKPLNNVLGGILTFESDWSPKLGKALQKALDASPPIGRLDLGCIAVHGYFHLNQDTEEYDLTNGGKAATAFLFKLISKLQASATVPMIDIEAYGQWLAK